MRFGCCGSMISPSSDPIGIEIVEAATELGFDYIEFALSPLTMLSPPTFSRLIGRVERSGIRCEACNNFFPPRIRLTGSEVQPAAVLDYAAKAMERAAMLGVSVIVFGSSGAKNVPEGFPKETAWKQLVELLGNLGPTAEQHGITIAIEPLNKQESNIINLASEGLRLVREVRHPNIQLLVDFYHLTIEQEDPDILIQADSAVRHVHFAKVEGRVFPMEPEDAFVRFFSFLKDIHYDGRCSVEGNTCDFQTDARRALRLLRDLTAGGQPQWN